MTQMLDLWRDMDRNFSGLSGWQPLVRQLDEFLRTNAPRDTEARMLIPSCDIEETPEHYLLSFDMPGLEKDQIDVEMQGNRLIVSGERSQESQKGEGVARMVERRYGRFERVVTLPEDIRAEEVDAHYTNGVLKLTIPKALQSQRQKIKIGDQARVQDRVPEGKGGSQPKLAQ